MNDKDFLSQFDLLRSNDKEKVLAACDKILKTVVAVSHTQSQGARKESIFGENLPEEVEYAVKRLLNGIISTSPESQLNFALCLGAVLRKVGAQLDFKKTYEYVLQKSGKDQAFNKTERVFFAVGKMYVFQAFVRERFVRTPEQFESVYQNLFRELSFTPSLLPCALEVVRVSLEDGENFQQKYKTVLRLGQQIQQAQDLDSVLYLMILDGLCRAHKTTFALENLLRDKVGNTKNLVKAVQRELANFPQTHAAIELITRYTKLHNPQFARVLFEALLQQVCTDHKGYHLTFAFLKGFLEACDFSDVNNILIEELWHLWLKNLNVKNQHVKLLATQTLTALIDLVKRTDKPANQQHIYDFLVLLRSRSSYRYGKRASEGE